MPLQEIVAPWDQQPQGWVELDLASPLAQMVRSVLIGGQVFDVARSGLHTVAGTKARPTEQGLATAFNATLGTSSTDSVTTTLTAHATQRSYFARVRVRSAADSGAIGRLFEKRTGAEAQSELVIVAQGSANRYEYARQFSTTAGTWGTPNGSITVGQWQDVGISYDSSSTANDPAMYLAGQAVTVTESATPAGSLVNNAAAYVWGNRTNDNARCLDGEIAVGYIFDGILTPEQHYSLSQNPWQLLARREWVPMAAASGNQTLTPALFTNSNTFYSAVVSQAGGAQTLTPSLYTNTNAFYPATVTPGAVSLAPSLFTNSNTFYSATVSLGGSPQTLTPALFTNAQSFFAPTVSRGAVSLAPALFTNTQTFYAPVVTNGVTLAPPLLTNSQTFYGASITLGPAVLRPALLANVNQFYTHALTGGVVRIKQKGLRKTRYTPGRVPSDAKELARFIQNELERLTDALESPFTHQLLEVLHAEPSRKSGEAAMVAYADGTDWNPGAGRGLYLYDPQTAAWTKL